jgi:hypothetical protein
MRIKSYIFWQQPCDLGRTRTCFCGSEQEPAHLRIHTFQHGAFQQVYNLFRSKRQALLFKACLQLASLEEVGNVQPGFVVV